MGGYLSNFFVELEYAIFVHLIYNIIRWSIALRVEGFRAGMTAK